MTPAAAPARAGASILVLPLAIAASIGLASPAPARADDDDPPGKKAEPAAPAGPAAADGEKEPEKKAGDPAADTTKWTALIGKLGSADWTEREKALQELSGADEGAIPLLEKASKAPDLDPEKEWRILECIKAIKWRLPEADVEALGDLFDAYPDRPPAERAVVVRALVAAGADARSALLKVARYDAEAELRAQAAEALLAMPSHPASDGVLLGVLDEQVAAAAEGDAALPKLQSARGMVLQRLGRDAEAKAALEAARALGASEIELEQRYAEVLESLGELDASVKVLEAALAQTPGNMQLAVRLGRALLLVDRTDEAKKLFAEIRATLEKAQDPAPYHEIVAALIESKQLDEAVLTARAALKAFPLASGLNVLLADAQRHAGLLAEAFLNYRIELQYVDPDAGAGKKLVAKITDLLKEQGLDRIVADPDTMWELRANRADARAHDALADRLLARGMTDEAIEHSRFAALLMPRDPSFRARLGERLLATGDAKAALPELKAALEDARSRREKARLEELVASAEAGAGADPSAVGPAAAAADVSSWSYRSAADANLEQPVESAGQAALASPIKIDPPEGSDAAPLVAAFLAGTAEVIAVDEELGKRKLRFRPPESSRDGARPDEESVIAPAALVPGGPGRFYAIYNRTLREPDRPRSSARSGGLEVFYVDADDGSVVETFILTGERAVAVVSDPARGLIAWLSEVAPGIGRLSAASLVEKRTLWNQRWKGLALGAPALAGDHVLQALDRGVLRITLEDGTIYNPAEGGRELSPRSGVIAGADGGFYYLSAKGWLVRFSVADGKASPLLALTARGLSTIAVGKDRVYVAGRGEELLAFALPGAPPAGGAEPPAAEPVWKVQLARTADRRLGMAGERLLSLSGVRDSYRGERPTVTVLDPATGGVAGSREVGRPASWAVVADDLVAVAGGNARAPGGFSLMGIAFGREIDPVRQRVAELDDVVVELESVGEDRAALIALKHLIAARGKRTPDDLTRLATTYRRLGRTARAKEVVEEALGLATAAPQRARLQTMLDELKAEDAPAEEEKKPDEGG